MKLRIILVVLSLLAFVSASVGGYLYHESLRQGALKEAERKGINSTETIRNHVSLFLSENLKAVRVLAGMKALSRALSEPTSSSIDEAHRILDHFQEALNADVCYLMSQEGITIASSNRHAPDSFLGENYAFRPYFREAIRGEPTLYLALGITSKKRGIYCSHPVYGDRGSLTAGVVVVKASIDSLEREFGKAFDGIAVLVSPEGVVFLANREDWLYRFMWKPSPEILSRVALARQFGEGPWTWTGLSPMDETHAMDRSGIKYVLHRAEIENYPGWVIIYLQSMTLISRDVSLSFMKTTGFVILTICVSIGVLILLLYKKASRLILQRRSAEKALRESEETALALLNAPTQAALLLDRSGKILALNTTAAERFGKPSRELIGRCAFQLFDPDIARTRKAHHEKVVSSGRPVRYEDRREGRWFNTHVYPVFDATGHVMRVAIFSQDVTEQKEAEQALKSAKEELTRYSRDLEKRVEKRTHEISSILKYTPAVVYLKDPNNRYTLVNSRFEEIFGVSNKDIRGKTEEEIFPRHEGEGWKLKDDQVLASGQSCQVEVVLPQTDGLHTYLSVKFPLFDEQARVSGLCGIATDITALKKAEDQLRKLSASMMSSQEKERTAIARELHDELGQMLTALRFEAVWIWERLKGSDPDAAERALTMCELIDKTIDDVRGMSIRLRPGVLDDLGLIPALDWYAAEFEKRTGIACTFLHDGGDKVGDGIATAAYRIAQEALTNAARHSRARQVQIALQGGNGGMSLTVSDDGKGFDPEALTGGGSLGIAGMRERATLVGGAMEIHSHPGRGTQVVFRVPALPAKEVLH